MLNTKTKKQQLQTQYQPYKAIKTNSLSLFLEDPSEKETKMEPKILNLSSNIYQQIKLTFWKRALNLHQHQSPKIVEVETAIEEFCHRPRLAENFSEAAYRGRCIDFIKAHKSKYTPQNNRNEQVNSRHVFCQIFV